MAPHLPYQLQLAHLSMLVGVAFTVPELLYGLLIPSGNDAAITLARAGAGSVDDFVELMNARALELDLHTTKFVNPDGSS